MSLAISIARSIAPLWPEMTTWDGIIVVGDGADFALRGGIGDLLRERQVGAEQRRHRALPDRNRLLHRLSAQLEQLRGGREVERSGRAQRRIFAKAVAGDEARGLLEIDAAVAGQRAIDRKRMGHDRRLRILGQLELVLRTVAHQPEQVLAERLIDFVRRRRARSGSPRRAPRPCRPPGCPAPEK